MSSLRLSIVALALLAGSGCATIRTLDVAYRQSGNGPLIMSGTRFDLHSIVDAERAERRHGIDAPLLPWADLPFSFFLDALVLPGTVALALW